MVNTQIIAGTHQRPAANAPSKSHPIRNNLVGVACVPQSVRLCSKAAGESVGFCSFCFERVVKATPWGAFRHSLKVERRYNEVQDEVYQAVFDAARKDIQQHLKGGNQWTDSFSMVKRQTHPELLRSKKTQSVITVGCLEPRLNLLRYLAPRPNEVDIVYPHPH